MDQADVAQRYLDQLDLPKVEASPAHKAALSRAHELRKFEIENYWKRSSYFWGFQIVAFGALALSAKDGKFYPALVLIVAVRGALTARTGVLTARGSKFWQANWEAHVDFLEQAVEGRLHTTAIIEKRLAHSVSRVNERLLEVIFWGWIAAFAARVAVILWPGLLSLYPAHAKALQIALPLLALCIGLYRLMRGTKSKLRGRAFWREDMEPFRDA